MTIATTAKEAVALGLKEYNNGLPCKYGHYSNRNTKGRSCVTCNTQRATEFRVKNPEKARASNRKFYYTHYEQELNRYAIYRNNNPEKCNEARKKYKIKHAERYAAINRANVSKYAAAKLNRTPKWLNEFDLYVIKEIYDLAIRRTKIHGFMWHVDHIIPLKGKLVSGLHVPNNLQVIPATENLRKLNKFIPE